MGNNIPDLPDSWWWQTIKYILAVLGLATGGLGYWTAHFIRTTEERLKQIEKNKVDVASCLHEHLLLVKAHENKMDSMQERFNESLARLELSQAEMLRRFESGQREVLALFEKGQKAIWHTLDPLGQDVSYMAGKMEGQRGTLRHKREEEEESS